MPYVTVYTPDGEKFEVASRDRADKLILEKGWTQLPPVEEKPKRATRKKKKEEVVEEAPKPEFDFESWADSSDES